MKFLHKQLFDFKSICLLTIGFLITQSQAIGQVSGYQGKRLVIKTDALAPVFERGFDVAAEYTLLRNVSLGIGITNTARQYNQELGRYNDACSDFIGRKARINDLQLYATLRFYLNQALPAPKGSYIFSRFNAGRATIDFNYPEYNNPFPPFSTCHQNILTNVRTSRFTIGSGYQEILWERFIIDFHFGFTFGSLNAMGEVENYNLRLTNFTNRYGPNVYGDAWYSELPGGAGLSLHLKLGVLLF